MKAVGSTSREQTSGSRWTLRDLESRRSLHDEDSAVLPDAEKKAQSVLDAAEDTQHNARERCDIPWTLHAEISAKLSCVPEKASLDFNRRQHVSTVVSKDHNCIVAAVVQQVEEVS